MLWWTLRQLKSKDSKTREQAAEALGKRGDARAVEPLIAALQSLNWQVRKAAAEALGQIGNARAIGPLVVALRSWQVREAATKALGQIGEPAVKPLLVALQSLNWQVRKAAAKALGQIGDARAIGPLVVALQDKEVREAAAEALELLHWQPMDDNHRALLAVASCKWKEAASLGSAAVEPLVAALQDKDWWVRGAAAKALGKIRDARAVEPLIAALQDKDWWVRGAAAEALGQIGDARAIGPLVVALKDKYSGVREAAAEALELLHWQPMDDTHRALLAVASCKWKEATSLGPAAVGPLVVALKDTLPVMQQLTEMLAVALQGEDWVMQESSVVRRAAAEALGKIGDARAVEPLIAALKDEDEYVRRAAAEALRSMVDARAVHALITMACAHPEGADVAIAILQELLERAAGGIVAEDLRALTRLNNVVGIVTRTEGGPCGEGTLTYPSKEPVDCFQVRQLARQELIRRGLEA